MDFFIRAVIQRRINFWLLRLVSTAVKVMDIPTAQLLLQVLHIIPNIVGAIDTTEKDDNIILGDKNMKETVS